MTEQGLVKETEIVALGKNVDLQHCSLFDLGLGFFLLGEVKSTTTSNSDFGTKSASGSYLTATLGWNLSGLAAHFL